MSDRHVEDVPGDPGPVTELFAWVSIDAMGGVGLCALEVPGTGWLPLVAQRRDLAERQLGQLVREHLAPKAKARTYELRRYEQADVVDSFYEPPASS